MSLFEYLQYVRLTQKCDNFLVIGDRHGRFGRANRMTGRQRWSRRYKRRIIGMLHRRHHPASSRTFDRQTRIHKRGFPMYVINEELLASRIDFRLPRVVQIHIDDGECVYQVHQIAIMLVALKERRITTNSICHVLKCRNIIVNLYGILVCVQQRVEVRSTDQHECWMRLTKYRLELCTRLHLSR